MVLQPTCPTRLSIRLTGEPPKHDHMLSLAALQARERAKLKLSEDQEIAVTYDDSTGK